MSKGKCTNPACGTENVTLVGKDDLCWPCYAHWIRHGRHREVPLHYGETAPCIDCGTGVLITRAHHKGRCQRCKNHFIKHGRAWPTKKNGDTVKQ